MAKAAYWTVTDIEVLLRHSKYQLLIQRLVLFFYPMAAQKL